MQLGFYFDQTRCIGCFTCCVACKDWNDIPAGPAHWRRVSCLEEGEYPKLFVAYLSGACYHCIDPVCVSVCPAKAISKREEDSIVVVDKDKCREATPCGIISHYDTSVSTNGIRQAPCEVVCPAHVAVPGYIALLASRRYEEALDLIRQNLPLPSICGRICHHPCESVCKRQELDEPIAISDLKRFITDHAGTLPPPLTRTKAERVAIIGAGPAGLACAYDLLRKGYGVTIFEALPVAGGMLSVGIPEYRLPKDVLNRDIEYLRALGVEIKTNSALGTGLTLDDLERKGYGAICIAIGTQKGTTPDIPGIDLNGVMIGLTFLKETNLGNKVKVRERVLVVGGGNVALECGRVAKRLGAKEVYVVCPESRENMPAFPIEIEEGLDEGLVLHPSIVVLKVLGSDGRVTAVECGRVKRMEFDDEGRLHTDIIDGSEHTMFADNVIFAIGQTLNINSTERMEGIKLTKRGTIAIDPETMETTRPGIFAGGDAVTGPSTVIEAITSCQKAAIYIDRYLSGEVMRDSLPRQEINASDIKVSIPAEVKKQRRQEMPVLSPSRRVKGFDEVALGYSEEGALAEAGRCLNCAGSLCRVVCPYSAPQFDVGEKPKMQMCNFCLDRWAEGKKPICVEACPMRALDAGSLEELKAKYGETQDATLFTYSPKVKPSIIFRPKKR